MEKLYNIINYTSFVFYEKSYKSLEIHCFISIKFLMKTYVDYFIVINARTSYD